MMQIELRPLAIHHATALFDFSRDERIWKYMTFSLFELDDFQNFVKSEIEKSNIGVSIPFVIVLSKKNEVIGFTKLYDKNEVHKTVSSGLTWINPALWGLGINIQVKLHLLNICFNKLEMNRVQYVVDEANVRSQKSLMNMNAKFEGVFRNFRNYPSKLYKNAFIYSHIIDEWTLVNHHLKSLLTDIR